MSDTTPEEKTKVNPEDFDPKTHMPEHDKLNETWIRGADKDHAADILITFLEGMGENDGLTLCRYQKGYRDEDGNWSREGYYPVGYSQIKRIVIEYLGIDFDKWMDEKDQLAAALPYLVHKN